MSRPKSEINPVPGQRLKTILDEQGMSQSELSRQIHLSQQTISRMIQGTASVTPQTAGQVIALFPQYRESWLMGYDDQKTGSDSLNAFFQNVNAESDKLWNMLLSAATLEGYEITFADPKNAYTQAVRGYTISRDGKSASISIGDMNNLQNEISYYIGCALQRIIDKQNKTPEVHTWTRENGQIVEK